MPAPIVLAKGTKQYVPVKVSDALAHLTSLSGADLRFDVFKADDDETQIWDNLTCSYDIDDELIALPLIDTATLDEGMYKLFISFVASPEIPYLGPFFFRVDD